VARQQAADVPDRCGIGREVTAEGPVDLQLNQTRREQAALAIDDEVFGGIVTSWLRPEARMPPGSKTTWDEMSRLVNEGKIRHAGVCNFDVQLLEHAETVRHVDSLQPPFSLIRRDSGRDVIPWAADHGTGVIVYSPMQSGILTDSFSAKRVAAMAETDWRRRAPNFIEPALSGNLALRDALRPIAERHGSTVAAVAIGWVLAWPGVTGAIVGARSPEQVDGWIGGSQIRLTEDDLAEVANAATAARAGSGPVHPLVAVSQRS